LLSELATYLICFDTHPVEAEASGPSEGGD